MVAERSRWMPSAAASREASLRSSLYEAKPSISRGSRPASAQAARMALSASLNSASGDWPWR